MVPDDVWSPFDGPGAVGGGSTDGRSRFDDTFHTNTTMRFIRTLSTVHLQMLLKSLVPQVPQGDQSLWSFAD